MATHDLFQTKYVTWNNFGMSKEDMDLTTYQLVAEYLDRLGIHEGTMGHYHQYEMDQGVKAGSLEYMHGLELLQYDLLYGEQYVYGEAGSPITEGHMVMGVKDARITDLVAQLDGTYSVYGENFTKQSKVYINGEKQTSKFLNNTRIDLKESKLEDGDIIKVDQVGSSNTIFRESVEYEYKDGKLTELPRAEDAVETGRDAFVDKENE